MSIIITVKDGVCHGGVHQVGQVITVERTTPGGMCIGACALSANLLEEIGYPDVRK